MVWFFYKRCNFSTLKIYELPQNLVQFSYQDPLYNEFKGLKKISPSLEITRACILRFEVHSQFYLVSNCPIWSNVGGLIICVTEYGSGANLSRGQEK